MEEKRQAYTVLYDGDCPICTRSVEELEKWDRDGVLEMVPIQDPEVPERFPGLSRRALEESIHLVGADGKVWTGAAAVEELMGILPRWRWLSWLFHLPLVRPLGTRVYRWVARNRHRLV